MLPVAHLVEGGYQVIHAQREEAKQRCVAAE